MNHDKDIDELVELIKPSKDFNRWLDRITWPIYHGSIVVLLSWVAVLAWGY